MIDPQQLHFDPDHEDDPTLLVADGVALVERAAVEGNTAQRRIDVRLATWGEVASRTSEGYSETLARGAFGRVDPARVTLESQYHGGSVVGVAERIDQRAADAVATFRIAATPAGDEILALVSEGVLTDASVAMLPVLGGHHIRPDGVVERSAVDLRRVALVAHGAYPSARVLAYRSHPTPGGPPIMLTPPVAGQPAAAPPAPTPVLLGTLPAPGLAAVPPAPGQLAAAPPVPGTLAAAPPPAPGLAAVPPAPGLAAVPPAPGLAAVPPAPGLAAVPPVPGTLERSADAPGGRLDGLESRLAAIETAPAIIGLGGSALSRFGSFGEYCAESYGNPELGRELERALATQKTGASPGVLGGGPSWLSDVKGIVDQARPVVEGFGVRPLGASGMTVDWPVFAGDLSALVAEQATQLAEITSVQVNITAGQGTVGTYAGGSRLSKQNIERSEPSYRDAYERIMVAAYAKVTDTVFTKALIAAATGARTIVGLLREEQSGNASSNDNVTISGHGYSDGDRVTITALTGGAPLVVGGKYHVVSKTTNTFKLALTEGGSAIDIASASTIKVREIRDDDGTALFAALFEASIAAEDATGAPASVAFAGTSLFGEVARMSRIVPASGGPSNAVGAASAASLEVRVGDITLKRASALAPWKGLASNGIAAGWHEDGPRPLSADVVGTLGTDVAVYGFGAPGVYVPAGVVELTP